MSNIVNLPARPTFDLTDPVSCVLDLLNFKSKDFFALVGTFEEAIAANPDLDPLPVHTGWNEITPAMSINLLLRNRQGANRKVDASTVLYYARQMANDDWKATGQPILMTDKGVLADAQHRLYAGLISGVTFKSFVVTDIESFPALFSYIDNGRVRTAATALQTLGLNGVTPIIVKAIKIAEEVRNGVYSPTGLTKLPRLSPAEMVRLIENHPNARKAARSANSDWDEAVAFLEGRKDVVAYLGMRIIDLHGEEKADEFFDEVTRSVEELPPSDPFLDLHKLVVKDARAERQMKPRHLLGNLIKVFNAWHTSTPLGRRWTMLVDEEFPTLATADFSTEEEVA